MRFRLTTKLNDGKAEAPALEVDVTDIDRLHECIEEELHSDEGVFIGVGASILIERLR